MAIPLYCHARQSVTYIEYVASANTGSSTASYVKLDNIKPTGKWKIMVDFSVEDASSIMAIFSCKRSTSTVQWKRLNLYNISGEYRLDMLADDGTGRRHLTGAHAVADFRQTFVYDAGKLYLDGRLVVDASSENGLLTADNREPIVIFGDPRLEGQTFTNLGKGKIFRVRMWDETGVKVCDLHPCLDSNGVAALYDSVNDTIHYSLGAAFKPGAVVPPEGVEPVWMEKSFAVDGISLTNMAARATWNVTLGGVAASSGSEAGRKSSSDTWTMFDSALEAFKGDVQSVALWNRALSDAEVYAAFSQAPATGLTVIIK